MQLPWNLPGTFPQLSWNLPGTFPAALMVRRSSQSQVSYTNYCTPSISDKSKYVPSRSRECMHVHRLVYTYTHTCVIVQTFDNNIKSHTSIHIYYTVLYGFQYTHVAISFTWAINISKHKGVHKEVYTCI